MESIHVQVSPMGNRCGLVAYQDKTRALLLLVLPKLWRLGGPSSNCKPFPELPDSVMTVRVVAYEGDTQKVQCSAGWKKLLEDCIECLTERVVTDLKQANDDPRRADEAELPPSLRHLLVLGRGVVGAKHVSAPDRIEPDVDTGLDALIALAVRSGAWKHGPVESTPRDDGLGALFREAEEHTGDPLRIMAAQYFVAEVTARARDVRQGYIETTETLPVIRGRITARGMTALAYSGVPLAECTYDDFTPGLMLFRVIVTALDRVATGATFPSLIAEALRPLCGRALALRHVLAHIPSLPLATAASEARRCRLGPLLRAWQPVLDVARLLLRDDPIELSPAEGAPSAHTWVLETPKVWEGILDALARKAGHEPDSQSKIEAPWEPGDSTNVDLRLNCSKDVYLVDAKYKVPRGNNLSPGIGDLYQIFAYTHLAESEAEVHAALVYPAQFEEKILTVRTRRHDPEVKLRIGQVVFPSDDAVKMDEAWDKYLSDAAEQFKMVVFGEGKTCESP